MAMQVLTDTDGEAAIVSDTDSGAIVLELD